MKLTEYNKIEWRSVVKKLKPGLTDEEYDRMWQDFVRVKAIKRMH